MPQNKGPQKSYDDPKRDRGAKESPGHREKESSGSADRDFRGDRQHEDPMKNPRDGSPREPRS
ncbi:MAG: hypothetical protein ACRD16_16025 [Thermoanaerobaculia bacterium]